MDNALNYPESTRKLFRYYKDLADKAIAQVEDRDMHFVPAEESNSIAVIIRHMSGNMLSRWTDFLNSDGEKEWRDRDSEFVEGTDDKTTLLAQWEKGWACLFAAIDPLTTNDLGKIVYIRNEGHTVLEAINRQLAHYAYHCGQIVYVARIIRSSSWKSLSIPRNASRTFNEEKFKQEKQRKNFI